MAEIQKVKLCQESKDYLAGLDNDQINSWLEDLDKDFGLCKELGKHCTYFMNFKEVRDEAKNLKDACQKMRESLDVLLDCIEHESMRRFKAQKAKNKYVTFS